MGHSGLENGRCKCSGGSAHSWGWFIFAIGLEVVSVGRGVGSLERAS